MFSSRLPSNLAPNRLARAIERRRAAGRAIADLTESNPTRAGFQYPRDLLSPLADARALSYEPQPFGLIDARRAIAADYARRGIDVDEERIVLTASTSEAYSLLFKLLCDPADEVLVPRPSYPLFDHLTRLDAVVTRPYALEYHGAWSVDVASVEHVASTPAAFGWTWDIAVRDTTANTPCGGETFGVVGIDGIVRVGYDRAHPDGSNGVGVDLRK